ncbi:MAG: 3'-5' exonuclease [Phocaeicola sp.]|nr:3'-5' exonuclease [Phocaeicola sp.]
MPEYQSTIDKKEISEMEKVLFPGRIILIFTVADAKKAIDYLNTCTVVGVDTETRPSFTKGRVNKVALLQISTEDTCFLFRLNSIGIPDFVEDFLQNDVLKIGLSLRDDFNMLRKRNHKDPREGNWIELQDYVSRFGIQEKSLQKIYAILFGKKISKNQRLSNWEADVLTEGQQLYAATDAWASLKIYLKLAESEETEEFGKSYN